MIVPVTGLLYVVWYSSVIYDDWMIFQYYSLV